MNRVLIVPAPVGTFAKQLDEDLRGAEYETLEVENCEEAWRTIERDVGNFRIVVVCDMWGHVEHSASWLADVLARQLPDLPIVIITDDAPTAIIYREAEQTGAFMIGKEKLNSETVVAIVEDLVL